MFTQMQSVSEMNDSPFERGASFVAGELSSKSSQEAKPPTGLTSPNTAGSPPQERGNPPQPSEAMGLLLSAHMARLPVGLEVMVPVREFRVSQLLAINAGDVIETRWTQGEDLPLVSGYVQLAWSEFEVVDSRLAVRVTRLA